MKARGVSRGVRLFQPLAARDRCEQQAHDGTATLSRNVVQHAHSIARQIRARAVLIYADAIGDEDELRRLLGAVNYRTILITRSSENVQRPDCEDCTWVAVPDVHMTRTGQVKMALLSCLAKGVLDAADRVVCLTGIDGSSTIDTLMVLDLGTEPELFAMSGGFALGGGIRFDVFERPSASRRNLQWRDAKGGRSASSSFSATARMCRLNRGTSF